MTAVVIQVLPETAYPSQPPAPEPEEAEEPEDARPNPALMLLFGRHALG